MGSIKANFDLASPMELESGQMLKAIGRSRDSGGMASFMGRQFNNHKMEMR